MMRSKWLAGLAALLPLSALGQSLPALPALNIDIAQTSISGLSSGAFMAVQFEVAHSSIIQGAGVVAGGPYYCAQDDISRATTRCSCTADPAHKLCSVSASSADVAALQRATEKFFAAHLIDDPHNVARHRVYILSGKQDPVVPSAVAQQQLAAYYQGLSASAVSAVVNPDMGHTMPTVDFGNACSVTGSPYIGKCGFDAAGEILTWIYSMPKTRPAGALSGTFIQFDQSRYVTSQSFFSPTGMDSSGWLYVPAPCAQGQRCRLHVALHGCQQGQGYLALSPPPGGDPYYGTTFVRHAGYAEWADAGNIVVLFPQAVSNPLVNPNGCWDWWGYTGANYANQNGVQIKAIRAMVDRLASGVH